jgi:hypothetical protein
LSWFVGVVFDVSASSRESLPEKWFSFMGEAGTVNGLFDKDAATLRFFDVVKAFGESVI